MRRTHLCAVAVLVFFSPSVQASDWPQWRGRDRDGVWHPTEPIKSFPSRGPAARWRQPLGGGYGGIATSNGRVYVMDRQKEPREVERVLCFDAKTGKPVWEYAYPVAYGKLDYGNGPRATPTIHKGLVYTLGALGHLHCLDAARGALRWQCDTAKVFQGRLPTWGHACSPLVDGDRLLVQVGGQPNACLVALNRETGQETWRSLSDRPGYSSPVLARVGDRMQLLYWAAEHLSGLDPTTGKILWQIPHTTNYDVTISDPIYHQGLLLVSDYWEGSIAARLMGDGEKPEILWRGKKPLSQLMASPLTRAGHVYALDRFNGLKCIEIATGKVKWEGQHVTPKGTNPHASLIWAEDKAMILNAKGELILARLSPEKYEELGKMKVIDDTWAHPGFLDNAVFARNDKEIVCVPLR